MYPTQKDNVDSELRQVRNRELELKRITGEISCAECRRLKLKCDKGVPCSSCIRRGCEQICPIGINTGSGARKIVINSVPLTLSDDGETSRKVIAMSERIRALEDALQIQSGDESHPLLAPEYLAIKQGIDVVNRSTEEAADGDDEESLVGAFGTLQVCEGKTMRFLGASAADNVILMEVADPASETQFIKAKNLSKELVQASTMWPFTPAYLSQPEYIAQLVSQLPPYERATTLLEAYFSTLSWFMAPVDRSQVVDEIMPLFYPGRRIVSPRLVHAEKLHDLALIFIVFACGAVADLTQSPINPEGERFTQLARAALGMRSFLDFGSLEAAQTLFLMGAYEIYSARKISQESSWKFISIGMTVAASIGLHRDPSRWKLNSKMVDWRRRVFWEVNAIDKWKSLGSGRPITFPCYAIDCEFPLDRGATVEEDGEIIESVWQWRYRFARDVLAVLTEKLCAARPPKYSDIMEMDRLTRDFEVHPFVDRRPKPFYTLETEGDYKKLHPYVTVWWKEMALLFIHRNYFARALLEYPNDPIRSPYGPSFLATYRSATVLLELVRGAALHTSLTLGRLWSLWAIALSCAVIVSSVACRPSTISFAASALNELEKAIGAFEAGSGHPIAQNGLKLLYRLRDKVNSAFRKHNFDSPRANAEKLDASQLQVSSLPRLLDELVDNEEELNILRGTTRYVEQQSFSSHVLQGASYSQALLTGSEASFSSTGSSNTTVSPALDSPSTSPTNTSSEHDATPSSAPRESLFACVARTRGVESLLGPSPVVRSPPEASTSSLETINNRSCQYDNYLPPFVEPRPQVPSQPLMQSNAAEVTPAGSILPQPSGPQQQSIDSSQPLPSGSHPQEPSSHLFGSQGLLGPGFSVGNESTGTSSSIPGVPPNDFDLFANLGSQTFPLFDCTQDPANATNAFFSGPPRDPQVVVDLDALYQKEDISGAEAWDSFMQQFDLATRDASYESWEAMVYS